MTRERRGTQGEPETGWLAGGIYHDRRILPGFRSPFEFVLLALALALTDDFLHDVPMHICQAEVAAAEAVGEFLVVDAELV